MKQETYAKMYKKLPENVIHLNKIITNLFVNIILNFTNLMYTCKRSQYMGWEAAIELEYG